MNLVDPPVNRGSWGNILREKGPRRVFAAMMVEATKVARQFLHSDEDVVSVLRRIAPQVLELVLEKQTSEATKLAVDCLARREAFEHIASDVQCWGRCILFPQAGRVADTGRARDAAHADSKITSTFAEALSHLDDQEIDVLVDVMVEKASLHDVASRAKIKEEEAREILLRAQYKLRKQLVMAELP